MSTVRDKSIEPLLATYGDLFTVAQKLHDNVIMLRDWTLSGSRLFRGPNTGSIETMRNRLGNIQNLIEKIEEMLYPPEKIY